MRLHHGCVTLSPATGWCGDDRPTEMEDPPWAWGAPTQRLAAWMNEKGQKQGTTLLPSCRALNFLSSAIPPCRASQLWTESFTNCELRSTFLPLTCGCRIFCSSHKKVKTSSVKRIYVITKMLPRSSLKVFQFSN